MAVYPGTPLRTNRAGLWGDRRDAGRRLAAQLAEHAAEGVAVVALPGGGVPVAAEVAVRLDAPLELLAVGPMAPPGLPGLVVGAVAEDGTGVINHAMARRVGMTELQTRRQMRDEAAALRARALRLRGRRPELDLRGREVIIVDDGLVTGLPALAAVRAARRRRAEHVVVAAPVASPDAIALLATEADDVVCSTVPERLDDTGRWYRDGAPGDDELAAMLAEHAEQPLGAGPSELEIDAGGVRLPARLTLVPGAQGLVLLAARPADGPRDDVVAARLTRAGFSTLTAGLLTPAETADRGAMFDIPLLSTRLEDLARWALTGPATHGQPLGCFGASTDAAAALRAAARIGGELRAVVSCRGRPDLAGERVAGVKAATLMIATEDDPAILALNRRAVDVLRCPQRLSVLPGDGDPGDEAVAVAALAADWFATFLTPAAPGEAAHR